MSELADVSLEIRIYATYESAMAAAQRGDEIEHRRLWRAFVDLHGQRSAQTVHFIERERGLC